VSQRRRQLDAMRHRLPTSALTIGSTSVLPASTVRDLEIFVDCDLVMCTHVCRTVSYCFAMLRQLRSIRYLVAASVFQSLVTALVLCRLECAGWSSGLPSTTPPVGPERSRSSNIPTSSLRPHHRTRLPELITYKVAVLAYRALTGDVPQYLRQFVRVADVLSRHRLRSSTSDDLIVSVVRLTSIGSRAFPVAGARI